MSSYTEKAKSISIMYPLFKYNGNAESSDSSGSLIFEMGGIPYQLVVDNIRGKPNSYSLTYSLIGFGFELYKDGSGGVLNIGYVKLESSLLYKIFDMGIVLSDQDTYYNSVARGIYRTWMINNIIDDEL